MCDTERLETAATLWEAVLEAKTGVYPATTPLDAAFERHGTAEMRRFVVGFVDEVEAAWQKALGEGYDDIFDWEFVPQWLTGVDWSGNVPVWIGR